MLICTHKLYFFCLLSVCESLLCVVVGLKDSSVISQEVKCPHAPHWPSWLSQVTHPIASMTQIILLAVCPCFHSYRDRFYQRLQRVSDRSLQPFCCCQKWPALPLERLKSHHKQNFSEVSRCLKSQLILLRWVVTLLLTLLVLQGMQIGFNFIQAKICAISNITLFIFGLQIRWEFVPYI